MNVRVHGYKIVLIFLLRSSILNPTVGLSQGHRPRHKFCARLIVVSWGFDVWHQNTEQQLDTTRLLIPILQPLNRRPITH